MKRLLAVSCAGAILVLAGCQSAPKRPQMALTGDPLIDGQAALNSGPPKDRILWEYRMAAEAMRRAEFDRAKPLLDDAIARLGGIYGPDQAAKRARGYFHAESSKMFIGEPYERVMAYYYRGILYWMDGEPDNARACFRSAQLEDSDAENNEYKCDYVLLDYLDGLISLKLDKEGADKFKRAESEARLAKPPLYDIQANTFIFLEFGRGPTKFASGEYREQLHFQPGYSAAQSVRIQADGQTLVAGAYDDLTFQATTRGGRVMDYVLKNKAVFKTSADIAGDVGLVGGLIAMQNRSSQDIGLGLIAAGLIGKIVSAATTPAADTRAWDNLPQYLSFASLRLPPGPHVIAVDFLDAAGRPLFNTQRKISVQIPANARDTVLFASDQS